MVILTQITKKLHCFMCYTVTMIIDKIIYSGSKNEYTILTGVDIYNIKDSTIAEFNLYKGKEITSDNLEHILYFDKVQRALEVCLKYLAYSRTAYQVKQKLKSLDFDDYVIEDAIYYLEEKGYLNDLSYASAYASDKANLAKDGPIKIKSYLMQKGIEKDTAALAAKQIPEDIYLENLLTLAIKKSEVLDEDKKYEKLYRYLLQKGYEPSMIKFGLREILK